MLTAAAKRDSCYDHLAGVLEAKPWLCGVREIPILFVLYTLALSFETKRRED